MWKTVLFFFAIVATEPVEFIATAAIFPDIYSMNQLIF